ncbi:MAG: hypothetical protein L6V81_05755 [Clostridium sp.]|nr:MAG: hypothetical protein L6V81_05755 [Clostridium sp.]
MNLQKEDFEYAYSDYSNPYKGLDLTIDSKPYEGEYVTSGDEVYELSDNVLKIS